MKTAAATSPSEPWNHSERDEIRRVTSELSGGRLGDQLLDSIRAALVSSVAELVGDSLEVVSDPATVRGRDRGLRRSGAAEGRGRRSVRGHDADGCALRSPRATRGVGPARALAGGGDQCGQAAVKTDIVHVVLPHYNRCPCLRRCRSRACRSGRVTETRRRRAFVRSNCPSSGRAG